MQIQSGVLADITMPSTFLGYNNLETNAKIISLIHNGELADVLVNIRGTEHEERGVRAHDHDRGAAFATCPVFVANGMAVMAWAYEVADFALVHLHDAIATGIRVTVLGIDVHLEDTGADIWTAVHLMPCGHGKDIEVDIVAEDLVLEDRTVLDDLVIELGEALLGLFELACHRAHEFLVAVFALKADGQRHALACGQSTRQHAEAGLVPFEIVE